MNNIINQKSLAHVISLALILCLLAGWEWSANHFAWSPLLMPAPSRIASVLHQGFSNGYFWPHIIATSFEVLTGLGAGILIGISCGIFLAQSAFIQTVCMPYLLASQVIPKLALAPLLTLWLGFGLLPMVVITALVCFFPILENTLTGLQQVEKSRLDLFRHLGATPWQTLWRLRLPSGIPTILAGIRVAAVLALVGAIVGEFIGANEGLGALIIAAQGSMDTALMFAVLFLITILGLLLYYLTLLLQYAFLRYFSLHHPKQ